MPSLRVVDKNGKTHQIQFSHMPSDGALDYAMQLKNISDPIPPHLRDVLSQETEDNITNHMLAITLEDYAARCTRPILAACAAILSESGLLEDDSIADALEDMARIVREKQGVPFRAK